MGRTCLNCNEPVEREYCPHCGQRARIGRLRVRELLRIAVEELLEFEGPIVRTVIGLTIRPGRVCLDFVEGRRRRYVNPIKYMLISAALYVFIVRVILKRDLGAGMAKLLGAPSAEELKSSGGGSEFAVRLSDGVQDSINLITVALVPVFALMLMILFWNNGTARRPQRLQNTNRSYHRNYAEHCVLALYVQGHQFVLTLIPGMLDANADPFWMAILLTLPIFYMSWAAMPFYGRGWYATVWRIVVLQIAFFIFTAIFSIVLVFTLSVIHGILVASTPATLL